MRQQTHAYDVSAHSILIAVNAAVKALKSVRHSNCVPIYHKYTHHAYYQTVFVNLNEYDGNSSPNKHFYILEMTPVFWEKREKIQMIDTNNFPFPFRG